LTDIPEIHYIAQAEENSRLNNMKKRRKTTKHKLIPAEKQERVILLEQRGHVSRLYAAGAGICRMSGVIFILYCGGIALAGSGSCFFLIWGGLGAASLILSAALRNRKLINAIPTWFKAVCGGLLGLGAVLFCSVEALILTQYGADAAPGADFCIVLGAQWKDNGPSEVLRRRLDTAIHYLNANPDTKVIVSGGQGGNEIISEASGMRGYLINAGIAEDRILIEDRSSNTYENLIFSSRLLNPDSDNVVIVTSNFHVFRALSIAKKQGYHSIEGQAADSLPAMLPNNLLREFLGVIKDYIKGNL